MARKDINITASPGEAGAYDPLVKTCLSVNARQDKKELEVLGGDFFQASSHLHEKIEDFKSEISKTHLVVIILLWADLIRKDRVFGERYLGMMKKLIEADLLQCISNKKKPTTLKDLSELDPSCIINNIRCFQEWSIDKREDFVLLYKTFSSWLAKETFAFIPEARDLDREVTQKRRISFEAYIEILKELDLREQILAKIFYLGGHRNLEEVLSMKIEDLDFEHNSIHFSEEGISYPRHLFLDLKDYIHDRRKGYVFLGREGERISHTTPFRALKTVAAKLGRDL